MFKIAHLALNYLFTHSLPGGRWFSPGTPGTKHKTDRRDMIEILLKVALNAMIIILWFLSCLLFFYETNWDINYNLLNPLEWWSRQISYAKRGAWICQKNELLHISCELLVLSDYIVISCMICMHLL